MPAILVQSSTKYVATQYLVLAKLNGKKYSVLRGVICNIIRPVQLTSCSKLATEAQE